MKAATAQKVAIYDVERSLRDESVPMPTKDIHLTETNIPERSAVIPKVTAKPFTVLTSTTPVPMLDPITELTKQMFRLALRVEVLANSRPKEHQKDGAVSKKLTSYQAQCIFCDSTAYYEKLLCPELMQALEKGRVHLDERNRIVDGTSG